MTPSAAISMLDRTVGRHGQAVTLRRMSGSVQADLAVRAFVREYRPDEVVGAIAQADSHVVLSPTQVVGSVFETAPIARNDKVVIRGRVRNVQAAEPVFVGDQLVRINLQVRG